MGTFNEQVLSPMGLPRQRPLESLAGAVCRPDVQGGGKFFRSAIMVAWVRTVADVACWLKVVKGPEAITPNPGFGCESIGLNVTRVC